MSKPQVASEPTLEEILASIRKMISDDKPGPNPMPDQMGRTPFGGDTRASSLSELEVRGGTEPAAPARKSSPNFNSLSDALKVATALSEQRRSLQQEVADAIDKGPRSNLDALAKVSADRVGAARALSDGRGGASDPVLSGPSARRSEPGVTSPGEGKRDLMSFDFGAVVPQRPETQADTSSGETKSAGASSSGGSAPAGEAQGPKAESKTEQGGEPRVLHLRTGLNAAGAHGAGFNVAPFPRPARETAKSSEPEAPATPERSSSEPAKESPAASLEPGAPLTVSAKEVTDSINAQSEALLDAVVELVQQEPGALSVFTSGASFIGGVSGKKESVETLPAIAEVSEATAVPVAPGKLDRTAAELLRPMMRQWLAENMERILEEALRSELNEKTQSGKEPGKT